MTAGPNRNRWGGHETQIAYEQERVYNLKLAGKSHAEIAQIMGISKGTVQNRFDAAKAQRIYPKVDEYRQIQLDRLERLLSHLSTKCAEGNPGAIGQAIAIHDRIARLLGLDSPIKVDATVTETTQQDLELAAMIREVRAKNVVEEARIKGSS
jgi:hypothetical protein